MGKPSSLKTMDTLNQMDERLDSLRRQDERGLNGRRLRAAERTCTLYAPTARNVGQLVTMRRGSYVVGKDGSLRRAA
jgi:hypothetical protein